jgi:membrane protein
LRKRHGLGFITMRPPWELRSPSIRCFPSRRWRTLLPVFDLTVGLASTSVLFALVYKYIPQVKMEWGDVWIGALVAAVLFNIGKVTIGYYLGRSAFAPIYGAAGSLLVLLLWAYYSAQIFLFGAELTKSFSFISGTRRGQKS